MEDENKTITNHFEKDSHCQVFNGPVTNCVFAMPGSTVTQQAAPPPPEPTEESAPPTAPPTERDEEMCIFVHPKMENDEQGWKIHDEVKRLVARQGIQEICAYLKQMSQEGRILLPPTPGNVYKELVRMGMPNGEGFSLKTFQKHYSK